MNEERKRLRLKTVWQHARDIVWSRRHRLLLGLVLTGITSLSSFVLPMSLKFLVDDVFIEGQGRLLFPLALWVGIATLVQAASAFGLSQLLGVTAQRSITEMRKTVQQHIMRLPVSYFDSTKSGALISRIMTDADGIRNLVGTGLVQVTSGTLTIAVALVILLSINWQLTVLTLLILAAFGSVMAVGFRRLRPLFRERGEINAEVTGRLGEALGGVRVVKAYTAEKREDLIFARGAHAFFRNVARSITALSAVTSGSRALFGIVGILLMTIGGRSILNGDMTLGDFSRYIAIILVMVGPLIQISSIGTQMSEAFAGLDRIREVMQVATEDEEDQNRKPLPSLDGEVEFRDVSFEYETDTPVLRRVSFRAAAGSTTALVGPSGSGKSTLIGLVMAFHRPNSGQILVDGHDLAELRQRDYRRHLGVVLQDNFLFDGTIAENIRYSRPHASEEDVRRVSRIAHCDEFIEAFDDGYNTIIGERGVKLSGGQRQRVAIARAVLADPTILILDEATSSLDSESEAMIQDGLGSLRQGRTTFVIAHRLSTIQSADQILVLEGGRIVERGTHEELLTAGGRYKDLYDKQYRVERNRFINPGEDFTPDPEKLEVPTATASARRSAL